jgi:hypothetical protein
MNGHRRTGAGLAAKASSDRFSLRAGIPCPWRLAWPRRAGPPFRDPASRPAGPGPAALLCGVRNLDVRQSGLFTAKPKRPAGGSALFTFSCELREGP